MDVRVVCIIYWNIGWVTKLTNQNITINIKRRPTNRLKKSICKIAQSKWKLCPNVAEGRAVDPTHAFTSVHASMRVCAHARD